MVRWLLSRCPNAAYTGSGVDLSEKRPSGDLVDIGMRSKGDVERSCVTWRSIAVVCSLALVAVACSPLVDGSVTTQVPRASSEQVPDAGDAPADGPAIVAFPQGPSALDDPSSSAFPQPLIDARDLVSGGPPPDGIPSIDDPVFLDVAKNLEILPPNEPVIALEINGDARAYPIRVLVWHEIVNDTVGGVPVVVTYCPLCNTAVAFDRRIGGASTTFGTSGLLYRSALVMYDRATESLWTHFDGTSVIGLLTGTVLDEYPSPLLAWSDFRAAYPTGSVLDWTRTGFTRDYGRSPYAGYDDPDANPDLFRGQVDDRAAAMRRVVGISVVDESAAYTLDMLRKGSGSATPVTVGGQDLTIFWREGQASALDEGTITDGKDVGSVGVFRTVVDQMPLTFGYDGEFFVDSETGSKWTIAGDAVAGPLKGSRLERVPHFDTFWFAWAAYEPNTVLIEE